MTLFAFESETHSMNHIANRREGHFPGHHGLELFYQTWGPASANAKTLVITHGLAEHSECYGHTAEALVELGWFVVAWDLRGHGRSEGKRGYVDRFRSYSLDLACLLRYLNEKSPNTSPLSAKFALIGHSMGGLITLQHILESGQSVSLPQPQAISLSSPQIGIALEVPAVKDFAARVLYRLAPKVTLSNEISYDDLTRDKELLKTYETDPLRQDKISPGVYLGMLDTIKYVQANASRFKLPILVQAAGDERIVSLPAIKDLVPKLGSADKKSIVYEGSRHEIFNDLDRKKVIADLNTFLSGHV